jgi:hypothetical protein
MQVSGKIKFAEKLLMKRAKFISAATDKNLMESPISKVICGVNNS